MWVAVCVACCAALAGCAAGGPDHPGAVAVVASTDVWGSVARTVAGGHIAVKFILTGADTDPHSYQATPADAAALADADLVVYNGGGYDPWVDRVLAGHPGIHAIDAYSFLGPVSEAPDEHVFYNLAVAKAVPSPSPNGWRSSTRPMRRTTAATPPSSDVAPTRSPTPSVRSPAATRPRASSRPSRSCTTC